MKKKDENRWDKQRLAIEVLSALIIAIISGKIGAVINQTVYNGNVITYNIYRDTIESINDRNKLSSVVA